jgi:hypothetical protein
MKSNSANGYCKKKHLWILEIEFKWSSVVHWAAIVI